MDRKYHTLNKGIPAGKKNTYIAMDTLSHREGLHFWIRNSEGVTISVYLSRSDARNLIEEITHRLF